MNERAPDPLGYTAGICVREARFPCDQGGGTAGAGPARGGCPLPACGKPMRIKPHQTATVKQNAKYNMKILSLASQLYRTSRLPSQVRLLAHFLETHIESWIPGWVTVKS